MAVHVRSARTPPQLRPTSPALPWPIPPAVVQRLAAREENRSSHAVISSVKPLAQQRLRKIGAASAGPAGPWPSNSAQLLGPGPAPPPAGRAQRPSADLRSLMCRAPRQPGFSARIAQLERWQAAAQRPYRSPRKASPAAAGLAFLSFFGRPLPGGAGIASWASAPLACVGPGISRNAQRRIDSPS